MYMITASALFVLGQTTALTLTVCLQLKDARGNSLPSSHSTRTVYVFNCSQCRSATAGLAIQSQPLLSLVDSQGPPTLGTTTDQVTTAVVRVDVVAHAPLVKILPRNLTMFG